MQFGSMADVSLAARDFYEAKQAIVVEHIEELTKALREADPYRVMTIYSMFGYGDLGKLLDLYRQRRFLVMNGGAESSISLVMTQALNEAGVPALPESHDCPPLTYNYNKVLFNNMLAGGFSGTNIQHGLVWAKNNFKEVAELNELVPWKRMVVKELLPEMLESSQLGAVGILYSFQSSIFVSRSFSPVPAGPNFSGLLAALYGSFPSTPIWITESSRPAFAAKAKIIFDSDSPYVDGRAAALIGGYVRAGGVFVATAMTGRYGDKPELSYDWLSQFGVRVAAPDEKTAPVAGEFDGTTFKLTSPLKLLAAPEGAKTLAASKDGGGLMIEVPFGKGSLILLLGEIKWGASTQLLKRLLRKAGAPLLVESTGEVKTALLQNNRSGRVYLPVFRELQGKHLYVERAECLKAGSIDVRIKITLPEGLYEVGSLPSDGAKRKMTAEQLSTEGVEFLGVYPGDLRVRTFDKSPP